MKSKSEDDEDGEGEEEEVVSALRVDKHIINGILQWIRKGSIRGSIFNLCGNTLGAGALSLPLAFESAGFIGGLVLLFLAAMTCIFSLDLLIDAREFTGLRSIEELIVVCYGRKMGYFVEFNIVVLCFGTAVAYIVTVGDLATPLLQLTPYSEYITPHITMVSFWLLLMGPLSTLKEMSSLIKTSSLGVLAILYLAVVTTTTSIQDVQQNGFSNSWGKATLFPSDLWRLLQAVPLFIFAFTCQINSIAIYNDLERRSRTRMKKVVRRSVGICLTVYTLMGLFGYLRFPLTVTGNILTNYCVNDPNSPNQVLIISAYIAIIFTVSFAFPLIMFPLRYIVNVMLCRPKSTSNNSSTTADNDTKDMFYRQLLGFLLSGVCLLLALVIPNISTIFSFIGGTCSAFCCFVVPAIISLKLQRGRSSCHTFMIYMLAIMAVIAGSLSTGYAVYSHLIHPVPAPKVCT